MCNIEEWNVIDANGNSHPQQRLYPCNRATPDRTPCESVRVYPMNDIRDPTIPVLPNPQYPLIGPPPASHPAPQEKKKSKAKDLALEWEIHLPWRKKKEKKKTTQTPTTPMMPHPFTHRQPAQVRLDLPLLVNPPAPQPHSPPRHPEPPVVLPISPHHPTPPHTPQQPERPRVIVMHPTRVHERDPIIVPARRHSHHHRPSRYRVHERDGGRHSSRPSREEGRGDRRGDRRDERREHTTSAERRRREEAEQRRVREEARAREAARRDADIARLDAEIARRRNDLQHAARTVAREDEVHRLNREIDRLQDELARQRRARRPYSVVVHQDDLRDLDPLYDDIHPRAAALRAAQIDRSRSSSRGRGGVRLGDRFRGWSRSAEEVEHIPRPIEPARREYDWVPFRRRHSVSEEVRPPLRYRRVVYEDEGRGWGHHR